MALRDVVPLPHLCLVNNANKLRMVCVTDVTCRRAWPAMRRSQGPCRAWAASKQRLRLGGGHQSRQRDLQLRLGDGHQSRQRDLQLRLGDGIRADGALQLRLSDGHQSRQRFTAKAGWWASEQTALCS
eukprot:362265-Chlamydomonas_euryale.AAC.3